MEDSARRHLLSGERVLWEGRPFAGLLLRPIDTFLVPFSLLWGGFALFWSASAWMTDADLSFQLFGLPFLVMGLYITIGRFLIDMRIRRGMVYLVTDRRILILRREGHATSKSVDIKRLPVLELNDRADGSGTIRFGPSDNWFGGNNFGLWQPTFDPTPQFIRIEGVRAVYELIQAHAG